MNDNEINANEKAKANQHDSYGMFTILAIIIPLAGFILGIVFLTKDKKVDKKLGEHLLALSILFGAFWWIILTMFVFNTTVTPVTINTSGITNVLDDTLITPSSVTARIGSEIRIGGAGGLAVTVQQVIDPVSTGDKYVTAKAGKRLVAVKLQIVNKGSSVNTGNSNSDVSLVGSDNQNATLFLYPITQCTNFSYGVYTLSPSASATGCVAFEIPNGVTVSKVQFVTFTGLSRNAGEWLVR